MPTVTGAWTPNATTNQRLRLEVDYSVPTPSAGQSSVTVTGGVYVRVRYGISDTNNSFSMGGTLGPSASGSRNVTVATDGRLLLQSFSQSVPLGASSSTRTVTASLTGIEYIGVTNRASVSATITIPARPVLAPSPPSSVTVERSSDARHTIRWEGTSTPERPVTSWKILRWSRSTQRTVAVATVAGSARSWVDTTSHYNDRVTWGVRAINAAGQSELTSSPVTNGTPAPATDLSVVRDGDDAVLSWTRRASVTEDAYQSLFVSSSSDDGTWSDFAPLSGHAQLPATLTSRHISGLDQTRQHRFRVRTTVPGPSGPLSVWSVASPTLQLAAPPLPPTLLEPRESRPVGEPVQFRWRHNARDGSKQAAVRLEYRLAGESEWTRFRDSPYTSDRDSFALPGPGEYEWRAQTRGVSHPDWSDWSEIGLFGHYNAPHILPAQPEDGGVWTSNRLAFDFELYDHEGQSDPVSAWSATLLRDGQIVDELHGGATSYTVLGSFPVPLEHQASYTLQYRARSATTGLWAESTVNFTVEFLSPLPPVASAQWLPDSGVVTLTATSSIDEGDGLYRVALPVTHDGDGGYLLPAAMTATHQGDGVYTVAAPSFADTVTTRWERSDDGGQTWTVLVDGAPLDTGLTDARVALNTRPLYRVVAISDLGVEAPSTPVEVETRSCDVWLHADDGTMARLVLDMEISHQHGHQVVTETYLSDDGSGLPVAHFGPARPHSASVSGTLLPAEQDLGSPRETWLRLLGQHVWYRDPHGEAFWSVIGGDVATSASSMQSIKLAFTVQQVRRVG